MIVERPLHPQYLSTTYLVAAGFLFVFVNTLVDIASLMLDPRISLEGTR